MVRNKIISILLWHEHENNFYVFGLQYHTGVYSRPYVLSENSKFLPNKTSPALNEFSFSETLFNISGEEDPNLNV